MRFSYHAEQWLPYPAAEVFEFFANPANLPPLMPRWQKARLEKSTVVPPPADVSANPASHAAGTGSHILLSFRPFPYSPIRLRWEAEITEFSWRRHFCDTQRKGPFAFWKHCHYIRATDLGGRGVTLVVDDIEYEPPLWFLGNMAHSLFLRKQIERTFAYRHAQTLKLLAGAAAPQKPRQSSSLAS